MLHCLVRWKNRHAWIFFSDCFFLNFRSISFILLKFLIFFFFSYHYLRVIFIFSSLILKILLSAKRTTGTRSFINFGYTYGSLESLLKMKPFHLKKSIYSIIVATDWTLVAIRQLFLTNWFMFWAVFLNDLLFELHLLMVDLCISQALPFQRIF